jgi:hypothetical protein
LWHPHLSLNKYPAAAGAGFSWLSSFTVALKRKNPGRNSLSATSQIYFNSFDFKSIYPLCQQQDYIYSGKYKNILTPSPNISIAR